MNDRKTVLVIDDDEGINQMLTRLLEDDYLVHAACSGEEGLRRFKEVNPHLVLLDLNMPRMSGMSVLKQLREVDGNVPVVIITAYGRVESAVQAMKLGATDYLEKPFRIERLKRQLRQCFPLQEKLLADLTTRRKIVGESRQMQEVWRVVERFAPSDVTILLEGESGTGKELFARAIHELSKRSQGPFVPLDCAALPESMVESEIFGYEKGAFTGAAERKTGRLEWANGGTLFLDEVGNLPLHIQAKLLRVIQELKLSRLGAKGPTSIDLDVRIVAASNKSLHELVQSGGFRGDLYYRLSAVTVQLPPLREREGDIERLAHHFLTSYRTKDGKPGSTFAPETIELLTRYPWPGNIRELENAVKSAVLRADGPIRPQHLPAQVQALRAPKPPQEDGGSKGMRLEVDLDFNITDGVDLKAFRDTVADTAEKELIARVTRHRGKKRSQLAELLHIDAKTLRSKLKKFGLDQ